MFWTCQLILVHYDTVTMSYGGDLPRLLGDLQYKHDALDSVEGAVLELYLFEQSVQSNRRESCEQTK